MVTHQGTNPIEQGLLSQLNMLLSLWYTDYAERFFLIFLDEKRYQKEKQFLILHGWKSREQKN